MSDPVTQTFTLDTRTASPPEGAVAGWEELRKRNERLQSRLADLKEGQQRMEDKLAKRDETIAKLDEANGRQCGTIMEQTRELTRLKKHIADPRTAAGHSASQDATIASLRSHLARATTIEAKAKAAAEEYHRNYATMRYETKAIQELATTLATPADAPVNSPMGETEAERNEAAYRDRGESKSLCCPACKSYFLTCGGATVRCGDCGHVANRADVTTRGETERRRETTQADSSRPSIIEGIDALRAAGGDAWDKVEDVDRELGQDARLASLERVADAARAYVEADVNSLVAYLPGLRFALTELDAKKERDDHDSDCLLSELRAMVQRQAAELDALEPWRIAIKGQATSKPLTINLNRLVEVKLTEAGFRIYAGHLDWLGYPIPENVGVGKPLRRSLWDLMRNFGTEFRSGPASFPFEGNNITLLPEEGS